MNCKPGDLAYIKTTIRTPENIGRFVEVIRPATPGEIFATECGHQIKYSGQKGSEFCWVVTSTSPLNCRVPDGRIFRLVFLIAQDNQLRPIRDQPGEDETLQWADVPRKVEA